MPYPPISGGGTGARVPELVTGSPFADLAALETWSQANPTELLNNETQYATANVGTAPNFITYEWIGSDGVYQANSWSNISGLTPQQSSAIQSVIDVDNNIIPMGTANGIGNSIATQIGNDEISFDGEIGTTRTTVRIGDNLTLGEDGAAAVLSDMIDNIRALPAGTLLNTDGSTGQNVVVRRDQLQSQTLQGLDNETRTGDWVAWVPVTADRIIKSIRVRFAQAATGVRFVIRQADDQTQTDGPVLYRSHTDAQWNAGEGLSVTADPQGGPGTYELTLANSAKVLQNKFVYVTVEQNTQGTGEIEFRGATLEIAGVTQFYAYLEQTFLIESRDELALKTDVNIPTEVAEGRVFDFSYGSESYSGTVYQQIIAPQDITFGDGTVDIPAIPDGAFHTVGDFIVSEYEQGLVFVLIKSTTSTGGVGDIEGVVVDSISYADGGNFTPPNVATNIKLGIMHSTKYENTDVSYELIRGNTGNVLGSDFSFAPITNSRSVVFTLPDAGEARIAASSILLPNEYAIGPAGQGSNNAGVITSAVVNPSNQLQVLVDLASPITLNVSDQVERYSVTSEVIRHLIVETGADAEASNGTLRLTPSSGGGGISYTSPNPANDELIIGKGNSTQAGASGIILNDEGNIPYEHIGEADITLTGSGGSITIDVNNIEQYRDRTIYINHTNTFTINLDDIQDFYDEDTPPFFLRFVLLTTRLCVVQGIVGQTIGGQTRQILDTNDSLTIELPDEGETNWPVLSESFGNLTNRLIRGYQLVTSNLAIDSSLNAHHMRKNEDTARTLTIADGLRSGSYFYFENNGLNEITVDTAGSETIEGSANFSVVRGELWLLTKDNSNVYRAFLINKTHLIENNIPRFDSLAQGKSGNPNNNTDEHFVLRTMWSGSRTLKLTINTVTISGFTPNVTGNDITILSYTITSTEWNSIYAADSNQLTYSIQDNSTDEFIYASVAKS